MFKPSILNLLTLIKYYLQNRISNLSDSCKFELLVLLDTDFRIFEYSSISNSPNYTKVMIIVPIIFDSRDLDRWAGYGLRRSCVRWINFRTRSLAIRIGVSDTSIRFATSTSSIGIGPPSTRYFTITRVVAGFVARSTFLSMSSPRRSSSTSWASWPPTNSGTNRVDLFIHIIRGNRKYFNSRVDPTESIRIIFWTRIIYLSVYLLTRIF